uniref:Ig-like domain-containing protein n=1 Tax=Amphiprion percula TaxID=161767 RepID=A0A3P8UDQ5_AMPPE
MYIFVVIYCLLTFSYLFDFSIVYAHIFFKIIYLLFTYLFVVLLLINDFLLVIGSHDTITAAVGEDVILPCHLEPPFDVHNLTVLWKHNGTAVHTYRSRRHNLDVQHNRTLLFHDEMVNGNISLKLFNVTEQDKGVYTYKIITYVFSCFIQTFSHESP